MTLELKPLGNSCNLGCTYCYQEPMRLAGNARASKGYDLDLMMKMADESGLNSPYTLFGGEALLLPKKDLEKVFKRSYEKYGTSSLQTNGSLITDDHIELFKKYNVTVGVSIDGPNDLNGLRLSASKNRTTDELTQASMDGIMKIAQNGISCGIIITVHKLNGTKETLPRLLNFVRWLGDIGIRGGNIHMLEIDSKEASSYGLTPEENEWAFLEMAKFFDAPENQDLHYDPFKELEEMQSSDDTGANCIWKSCDPMNTGAVYGIEGNGQLSNCGMVNKEGIEWTKAEDSAKLRDIVLYQTPPEKGGCQGCPFFLMCNGYCPGSSGESDWRNKTYYCSSLKKMFAYYEKKVESKGAVPFSKRPDRVELERVYLETLLRDPSFRPSFADLQKMSRRQARVVGVR
jgi:uncharacterized protein